MDKRTKKKQLKKKQEQPLKDREAYTIDREASVFDLLDSQLDGEVTSWNVCFQMDFHDWEVEMVNSFLNHIHS